MKIKLHIKKFLAVMLLTCSLVVPKPAHAFVWPAIAPAEIGLFVNNVITALSVIATDNAKIQGYIATIQAIGDQVSMVCKYAQDIGDAINSIEDSVERLGRVTREANEYVAITMETSVDDLANVNTENNQMADNLVNAVEKAMK
jgi:hypothetical protein